MSAVTETCTHPESAHSKLKSGDIRCTACATTLPADLMAGLKASLPAPTEPEAPRKLVCTSEPTPPGAQPPEAKLPGPAALLIERAAAAGWAPEVVDGNGGIEVTVKLRRGNETGHAAWELNGEGAWRFAGCLIGGRKYGAREIAARLREPAPEPGPMVPPPVTPATQDGQPMDTTGLATVTPIRPDVAAQLAPPPPSQPPAAPVVPVGTLASFMAAAPAPMNGNTPWAGRYAAELREVIHYHGRHSARNLQVHLGPSELGVPCDRQVAGKLAGIPATNHVVDPWPSILGTAGHAWLADAFKSENARHGLRWVPEYRVSPHPEHPGTADLYDGREQAVVDWKILSADKIGTIETKGPSVQYKIQLLLYGRGYRNLGLPVRRVVLVALPRTKGSLDSMYVWDHELTSADDEAIEEVFRLTAIRKQLAAEIVAGRHLLSIPATPDRDTCYFCPFYRPQAAQEGGIGCPGK